MYSYSIKEMLRKIRYYYKSGLITKQNFRTLQGVARTGDVIAAEKGLQKIMGRVKA